MNFKRLRLLRNAARVLRCHNAPMIHQQTVGEHTFGVMGVLITVYPEASTNLWRAVLYHDVPESVTGDVPGPTKWRYDKLETALREVEKDVRYEYDLKVPVSETELRVLKYCDLMELVIYGIEEADTGNKGGAVLAQNALAAIDLRRLHDISTAAYHLHCNMHAAMRTKGYNGTYGADTTHGTYTAHGE